MLGIPSCGTDVQGLNARDCQTLAPRSEEHTSELQSQFHLVCRLLLEKKKKKNSINSRHITSNLSLYALQFNRTLAAAKQRAVSIPLPHTAQLQHHFPRHTCTRPLRHT